MSDDLLRQLLDEVHETRIAVALLRGELTEYKDKIDSDIRELRGGGREAMASVTDLQKVLKDEKIAELKARHAIWVGTAGKVAIFILLGTLGWLGTWAVSKLHFK